MAFFALSHFWSFGDGTTSTEENPVHTYRMPGVYIWRHTVTDRFGRSGTVTGTIRVYDFDYLGGINVNKTDMCMRFAIPQQPQQGKGWSLYDDVNEGQRTFDWPYPMAVVGTVQIIDDNDQARLIVIDSNTFRHYELGVLDHWIDGEDQYGGSEIESEVLFREHTAPVGATAKIKHSQSHIDIKPWQKDLRGASGYTEEGFRNCFEADYYARVDSTDQDAAITKQIPLHGQLVFDRHLLSEFLQEGVVLRGAPWRVISVQQWFTQQDTAAAPPKKKMTEMQWSMELSQPVVWFPRTVNTGMNFATAIEAVGSVAGILTGPDSLARSAFVFGATDSFTVPNIGNLVADITLSSWVLNPTSGAVIFNLATGNLTVTLSLAAGVWQLTWSDSVNTGVFDLSGDLSAWTLLTVVKRGDTITVYENYTLVNTVSLTDSSITYGGRLVFGGPVGWFDCRILDKALSTDAIEYVYKDVTENNGNTVCPVF